MRRPQLFIQKPSTIQSNLEAVARHFGRDGLTLPAYLLAAVRQPSLFYMRPATVIRHVEKVIAMQHEGLVAFTVQELARPELPLYPLLAFLVKSPQYFCLADDNYALRVEYARVTGDRPGGVALLTRPRSRIERDLAQALGKPSPPHA